MEVTDLTHLHLQKTLIRSVTLCSGTYQGGNPGDIDPTISSESCSISQLTSKLVPPPNSHEGIPTRNFALSFKSTLSISWLKQLKIHAAHPPSQPTTPGLGINMQTYTIPVNCSPSPKWLWEWYFLLCSTIKRLIVFYSPAPCSGNFLFCLRVEVPIT